MAALPSPPTPLREKMIRDMQLHRLSPITQRIYLRAVWDLAAFYRCSPDRLQSEHIRAYLHHLLVDRKISWSACNQVISGLKFFYTQTLDWTAFQLNLPSQTKRKRLPQVLSVEELQRLFSVMRRPKHRVLLMTTYSAGLRVGEVVRLQLRDIESDRMLIRVNQGKGQKDRYTLLSSRLLAELRAYWKLQQPPQWLFPGRDLSQPMAVRTAQQVYMTARAKADLQHGPGIHTLRHCFATHLLEAGVDPRTIQVLMGHRSIQTTMGYLQVTRAHLGNVRSPFDLLHFDDLPSLTEE